MKTNKSYTIDQELIKKVKAKAREKRRSESFIVNDILQDYFENDKNKI